MVSPLIDRIQNIGNILFDSLRRDAMRFVPFLLLGTSTLCLIQRIAHRIGYSIRIENNPPFGISRRAANGLDKRSARAKIALFIRIQNPH